MFAGYDGLIGDLAGGLTQGRSDRWRATGGRPVVDGESLADALVAAGQVTRADLLGAVAQHLGLRAAAAPVAPHPAVRTLLPAGLARAYRVVPLREADGALEFAAVDPLDRRAAADLPILLGRPVRQVMADPDEVADLLRRTGGDDDEPGAAGGTRETVDGGWAGGAEAEPMVIRAVNQVLADAVRAGASDLHLEAFEREFRLRCRVDGTLRAVATRPAALAAPFASRLKVLAGLDIAERRRPQDGRIRLTVDHRAVDLRISTLPTQFGESVVLRVLDPGAAQRALADLGLPGALDQALRRALHRPHGLVLVTGPTGSGKTTTLYACLREINRAELKILTVEDPVEYEIDGPVQVSLNPAAGLTFPRALRAFLRQDPDVVLVGEIRDEETARIAVQAALTGHLVLSTLHTNDAPGAIARLADLGVEPFLLASTVRLVVAQRLVRRLCPACAVPAPEPGASGPSAGFPAGRTPRVPAGCPACDGTGWRGRMALYEWMELDEDLREAVVARAAPHELAQRARAGGLVPLRAAGLEAVAAGLTSWEEILRHT